VGVKVGVANFFLGYSTSNGYNNEDIIIFPIIFPSFLWLLYDKVIRFPKNFICNSKILNKLYLPEKK